MRTRRRTLPPGWYPGSGKEIVEVLSRWESDPLEGERTAAAGIVPHAGWFFSGRIAFRVLRHLQPDLGTLIVVGGHLPAGHTLLAAGEDFYETPLGPVPADLALLDSLAAGFPVLPDDYGDNSTEVLLPMVKHLFPNARALMLRVSPSDIAPALGNLLAGLAGETRPIGVIGSTDLTHYGPAYGYTPHGTGREAERWVVEVNDAGFIDRLVGMRAEEAIEHAALYRSACSAGAAACAVAFSRSRGVNRGLLLEHVTSLEMHRADSFVGYAGVLYRPEASA